jgi:hypothetical protein
LLASAAPLLATLPANVPLAYTYQVNATYYVAPASGVVVDLTQHEVRSAGISGAQGLPTFPVADITFTSTPASLQAAAKDARDKGNQISLVESTLPWSLGLAGGFLLLAGLGMYVVGRRPRTVVMPDVPTGRTIPTPRETVADKPATTERS